MNTAVVRKQSGRHVIMFGVIISILGLEALTQVAQGRGNAPMFQRSANQYPDQPPKYIVTRRPTQKRKPVRSVNAVRLLPATPPTKPTAGTTKATTSATAKPATPATKPTTPAATKSTNKP
jgi:hypothetical protein